MKESKGGEVPVLKFHEGTLVLENPTWRPDCGDPPYAVWDPRSCQWRARALYYRDLTEWFRFKKIPLEDRAVQFARLDLRLRLDVELHSYQREALGAWVKADGRGSVCLPTGSGKTMVALKAIEHVGQSTLVVLPTIDLMNQWYALLADAFGIEVGILGGGYHEVREVTVTTYDSAYLHIDRYGNRFALLVFDEVHHLPTATYALIPEMSLAPYRLGLTATYERPDGLHGKLDRLIGPKLYERTIKDLRGERLAEYEVVRFGVDLTPEELVRYRENQKTYTSYLREKGLRFYGPNVEAFLRESAYDPKARKALVAMHEARRIVLGAERKMELLESLLKRHGQDRVIVFTASNSLVYRISREFLIPAITHHTKAVERKRILEKFRGGEYRVLATSRVLNEGVDIPEANVAIILSGSASPIEHLQRLGRILRKVGDKQAILYEVVTRGTKESNISYRRRQSDAYR